MALIIPAILEKNFNEMKNKLMALRGNAECVHIDMCDGVAVPSQSWPFAAGGFEEANFMKIMNEEEGMPYWQDFDFELDLMVADAVENFDLYMKLGPKRIIFHPNLGGDTEEFGQFLEGMDIYIRDNVQIGLAFRPNDDLTVVTKLSNNVDFVHCMGSDRIGFQGEQFSEKALENIKFLRQSLSGLVISVDIGINLQNTEAILGAGADRLVVGSAIWRTPDPIGTLQSFQSLV